MVRVLLSCSRRVDEPTCAPIFVGSNFCVRVFDSDAKLSLDKSKSMQLIDIEDFDVIPDEAGSFHSDDDAAGLMNSEVRDAMAPNFNIEMFSKRLAGANQPLIQIAEDGEQQRVERFNDDESLKTIGLRWR